MLDYIWPVALVVLSNTVYQICAKSVPSSLNPFASLVVTYMVGAALALVLSLVTNRDGSFAGELRKLNWAPFVLGLVIVGLEVGFIFAYRAGWQVSMAQTVSSSALAVILIMVGHFAYGEPVSVLKVAGLAVCLVGLAMLNLG